MLERKDLKKWENDKERERERESKLVPLWERDRVILNENTVGWFALVESSLALSWKQQTEYGCVGVGQSTENERCSIDGEWVRKGKKVVCVKERENKEEWDRWKRNKM